MRRLLFVAFIIASCRCATAEMPWVELIRTPNDGKYPRAAVDGRGVVHLIYFDGLATKGDVNYVSSGDGGRTFAARVEVNSRPLTAMIIGTVRGPQIAIGRNNRVHVAWMGSSNSMYYTRIDDSGRKFEPQRNLVADRPGLDGGGNIAADANGNVFVAWHAPESPKSHDEAQRRVWVVRSRDDGKTFSKETNGGSAALGVCACCNLAAGVQDGSLFVLYRCATEKIHRDMHLLKFDDQLKCVADRTVAEVQVGKCVMSTASFASGACAFESNGQIHWMRLTEGAKPAAVPGGKGNRKHPSIATNAGGDVLLAWAEDSAWQDGGHVMWQLFDRQGKPYNEPERGVDLSPFSIPAAVARSDGSFLIFY